MNKFLLFIILTLIIGCGQNEPEIQPELITPITVNPLVNFQSFLNELPNEEKKCLISDFTNEEEAKIFVSENSLPNPSIKKCLSSNSNFRIIHGLFINKSIELSSSELQCIKSNSETEKFDYLGKDFAAPMFTYSLGSLFCLNESSRNVYDSSTGDNLFEGIIDNKPLISILPKNIKSLECMSEKTDFQSTKESLTFIYTSGGFFPIQIFSDLSNLVECIEIPEELAALGLNDSSSLCLSNKLENIFSDPLNPSLNDIPKIIIELEGCNIDAIALLRYFEFDVPEPVEKIEEVEIPEEALSDERFTCLSEKLDMNDVMEFLYTRKLTEKALISAEKCGITKEEIESIDLSEILENN